MSTVFAIVSGCFVESGTLSLNPNSQGLPGSGTLQDLVNGIGFWGLLAAWRGLIIGATTWALGAHTNNYQNTSTGRRAVLVSGCCDARHRRGADASQLPFQRRSGFALSRGHVAWSPSHRT